MNSEDSEQELSEHDRQETRRTIDILKPAVAAELLGLSPTQLAHIVLGFPVTSETARRCRAGLAEVSAALHDVLPLFEEPAPPSPEALREMMRETARTVLASVIASEARALGNDDGPRENPFMSAAWLDDSTNEQLQENS